jgi:hypothetical protein
VGYLLAESGMRSLRHGSPAAVSDDAALQDVCCTVAALMRQVSARLNCWPPMH